MLNDLLNLMSETTDSTIQHHLARAARRKLKLEIERFIPPKPKERRFIDEAVYPGDTDPNFPLTYTEWREAAIKGRKINAIKMVRQRMGGGLREVKNMVEEYAPYHANEQAKRVPF
jgi:hypothetical protein